MTNQMRYRGNLYGKFTGPSTTGIRTAAIWDDFPFERIRNNEVAGVATEYGSPGLGSSENGWLLTATNAAEAGAANATGSALSIDGADNDIGAISLANDALTLNTSSGLMCFETRIKVSNLTASKHTLFVGLCDGAPAAANPQNTGGTAIDQKSIGFFKDTGATTSVDAVSFGAAVNDIKAGVTTMTADTFIQLGLKYDPITQVVTFFVDGAAQDDTVAISNANTPNDVNLRAVVSSVSQAAQAQVLTIDWIRVGQINP